MYHAEEFCLFRKLRKGECREMETNAQSAHNLVNMLHQIPNRRRTENVAEKCLLSPAATSDRSSRVVPHKSAL